MTTITLNIPDEMTSQFASLDELRRAVYEDFVIEQRQQGVISLSKAAELLGIDYGEFFLLLGSKGLSFINAAPEELQESQKNFATLMQRHR